MSWTKIILLLLRLCEAADAGASQSPSLTFYLLSVGVVPCVFISSFALAGLASVISTQLYLGPLKFTQAEMIIPNVVSLLAAIPANIVGAVRTPFRLLHSAYTRPVEVLYLVSVWKQSTMQCILASSFSALVTRLRAFI
eukprot:COSAG02_NODE_2983_length_7620_cov_73.890271_4_plen_139_part_00